MNINLDDIVTLDDLSNVLDTINQRFQNSARELIFKSAKNILDKFPEINGITWTQYTPHFMDGDPCVFGISEVDVVFKETNTSDLDLSGEKLGKFTTPDRGKELWKEIDLFENALYPLKTMVQHTFGDGVTVTIDRENIHIEDYDHD